jgi:orotidine-5'-phosphate decarboxylase
VIEKLQASVKKRDSLLCVGLDFDPSKTPEKFRADPLAYNRVIIEATKDLACAYKPNIAFYEALGMDGLSALQKTMRIVPSDAFVILDAKRGDIGNTSRMYAKAAFEVFGADAVTVSPYMGEDSVAPFLGTPGKGVFVLCLTSNSGAKDFQKLPCPERYLYLEVAQKCNVWAKAHAGSGVGLVVGATQAEIAAVRGVSPLPFLVPGVGAQGGDLATAVREGNRGGLALINASRSVIYPEGKGDIGERIRAAALSLRDEINTIRAQEVK